MWAFTPGFSRANGVLGYAGHRQQLLEVGDLEQRPVGLDRGHRVSDVEARHDAGDGSRQ
jgi:hypothetical protein